LRKNLKRKGLAPVIRGNFAGITNLDPKIVKIKDLPCLPANDVWSEKANAANTRRALFLILDSSVRQKGLIIGKLGKRIW